MNTALWATVFLIAFSAVSSFDSLYYHFYKFKLHQRKKSFHEHLFHTSNILLFTLSTFFLFSKHTYASALWLGVAFSILFLASEFFDLSTEKKSRADFGGVPTAEYLCHFAMGVFRGAYMSLIVVAAITETSFPSLFQTWAVNIILVFSVGLSLVHIATLLTANRS